MTDQQPSERTRVSRYSGRGIYRRDEIYSLLDKSFLCQVGYTINGEARVLPNAYVRIGDALYLHGHLQNQMLNALLDGQTACISMTLLDGLVLARTGFNHSVNYRSVTVFGKAERVEENKAEILDAFINQIVPDRAPTIRAATPQELNATLLIKIPIDEAVAKVRSGPPKDKDSDYDNGIWAGVINLNTLAESVEPCPQLEANIPMPQHIESFMTQISLFE